MSEDEARIVEAAEPVADSILKGLSEDDYDLFSKNFGDTMRAALGKEAFRATREMVLSKVGEYVSRGKPSVVRQGPYLILVYKAKFSRQDTVLVKVVFAGGEELGEVVGLWFDSPELRGIAK